MTASADNDRSARAASSRLLGLDVARFLAFVGMVVVNFRLVVAPAATEPAWMVTLASSFEGRAAALFVVLAGVGLGLAAARAETGFRSVVLLRAAFLLVLGLVNAVIFPPDILHYYVFYFVLGAVCLRRGPRTLLALAAGVVALFPCALVLFDYDRGWDWQTLDYEGFWTARGFVRNLLFNGWHPVVPWAAFLLVGMALSRLRLERRRAQLALLGAGAGAAVIAEAVAAALGRTPLAADPEIRDAFLTTSMIPPTPLYMIAGTGVAAACIGACLLATPLLRAAGVLDLLATAGRQTLTLYIAHIVLGMGALEALGYLESGRAAVAGAAAGAFCVASIAWAWTWSRWSAHGPLEWLLRRMTGPRTARRPD